MPNFQNPTREGTEKSTDASAAVSATGQYEGLPPNVGMGLGPYEGRSVAAEMPHLHPSTSFGLPSASGQNVYAKASFDANPGRNK